MNNDNGLGNFLGPFAKKTPVLGWSRCFFILLGPGGKVIRRNGNCHGSCNFNLTNCLMKSIVPSIPNTDESMHR